MAISNVEELVESIKRAVAVPGTFADVFPETTDQDLTGALLDGLAAVQLDGLLNSVEYDTMTGAVTPELTRAQGALVIVWTAATIVENQITNRPTHVRFDGKGSVFEEDFGASMLVERLRQLAARKKDILEQARMGQLASAFYMADLAYVKAVHEYGTADLDFTTSLTRRF